MQRVAAATSPFVVLLVLPFGMRVALTGGSALLNASVLVGICSILLLLSAIWLSRTFFDRRTQWTSVGAVVLIYAGWLWQRIAYLRLIPDRFLKYGYFLTAPGKSARFFVLELPFETIASLMVIGYVTACVFAWRSGARWSLISLTVWWLTALLIFGMPSLDLYLQGDAAIFI